MAEWNIYTGSSPNRDNEEFEEAEVWSVMNETEDSSSPKMWRNSNKEIYYNKSNPTNAPTSAWPSPRKITKPSSSSSSSSTTTNEAKLGFHQSSAPLSIPEWSKIYGTNESSWGKQSYNGDHNSDEEEYNDFRVPPHEYLAKKLARSQISSSSVCEGIGRTLKGRDLSKVRNAVLTKTGFLE